MKGTKKTTNRRPQRARECVDRLAYYLVDDCCDCCCCYYC